MYSFGEEVQLLHPFHETFTEQSGANILRQFRFEQKKTKIAQVCFHLTRFLHVASTKSQIRSIIAKYGCIYEFINFIFAAVGLVYKCDDVSKVTCQHRK